jgi:hypothetical protein
MVSHAHLQKSTFLHSLLIKKVDLQKEANELPEQQPKYQLELSLTPLPNCRL